MSDWQTDGLFDLFKEQLETHPPLSGKRTMPLLAAGNSTMPVGLVLLLAEIIKRIERLDVWVYSKGE